MSSLSYKRDTRTLFLGGWDSFATRPSHETLVPVLRAFETSGHTLVLLDKMEIPVSVPHSGEFLIQAHQTEGIIYASLGSNLIVAAFHDNKFSKFRTLDNIAQSAVNLVAVADNGLQTVMYCPRSESLQFVFFNQGDGTQNVLYPSSLPVVSNDLDDC